MEVVFKKMICDAIADKDQFKDADSSCDTLRLTMTNTILKSNHTGEEQAQLFAQLLNLEQTASMIKECFALRDQAITINQPDAVTNDAKINIDFNNNSNTDSNTDNNPIINKLDTKLNAKLDTELNAELDAKLEAANIKTNEVSNQSSEQPTNTNLTTIMQTFTDETNKYKAKIQFLIDDTKKETHNELVKDLTYVKLIHLKNALTNAINQIKESAKLIDDSILKSQISNLEDGIKKIDRDMESISSTKCPKLGTMLSKLNDTMHFIDKKLEGQMDNVKKNGYEDDVKRCMDVLQPYIKCVSYDTDKNIMSITLHPTSYDTDFRIYKDLCKAIQHGDSILGPYLTNTLTRSRRISPNLLTIFSYLGYDTIIVSEDYFQLTRDYSRTQKYYNADRELFASKEAAFASFKPKA